MPFTQAFAARWSVKITMTLLSNERDREPALVTFLTAASGVTLLGIGSAFWGLIAGGLTLLVLRAMAKN